jgi:DNA helicase II / ATP-dependent DNA helicase PcrA
MSVGSTMVAMTREQRDICESRDRLTIVEANAGAGKTTLAVMKIASLVSRGANPSRIIALSYTKAGVIAYREAFARLAIPKRISDQVRIGTFDEFCVSRLDRLEGESGALLHRPEDVRVHVLSAIAKARTWAQESFGDVFDFDGGGEFAVEGLLKEFSRIKGTLALKRAPEEFSITPEWASELGMNFTALAIFRAYEGIRYRSKGLSGEEVPFRYVGDPTYDLARILSADDPIYDIDTHPLKMGLDAVILDEMHDTNWAMFKVLQELLSVNQRAVFLGVGDRDQVIHSNNGADAYFMGHGFREYIGEPKYMSLTVTYRCGEVLATPLGKVSNKKYLADSSYQSQFLIKKLSSARDVCNEISEILTARKNQIAGTKNSDVAILMRNPSAATDLEHELFKRSIRCRTVGFTTYLERPEILFVRAILSIAVNLKEHFQPEMETTAKLAIWEFIGGTLPRGEDNQDHTRSVVMSSNYENFTSVIFKVLLNTTSHAATRSQVNKAIEIASSDRIEDLSGALEALNIKEMASRVFVNSEDVRNVHGSLAGFAKAGMGATSISSFLRSLLSHDYERQAIKHSANSITLSSIEAVKGLEFDHVVFCNVNANEFDSRLEADRNLFYVAASRARKVLTILHKEGQPSSFLNYYAAHR